MPQPSRMCEAWMLPCQKRDDHYLRIMRAYAVSLPALWQGLGTPVAPVRDSMLSSNFRKACKAVKYSKTNAKPSWQMENKPAQLLAFILHNL